MTREERREIRHTLRKMWVVSMLLTVMVAAVVRRQQFEALGELEWWWTPLIAVVTNAVCWWLAIKLYWGNGK